MWRLLTEIYIDINLIHLEIMKYTTQKMIIILIDTVVWEQVEQG